MGDPPALKRPKLEKDDHDSAYCSRPSASAAASGDDEDEEAMAEEAVVALVAHRKRDVERCKLKLLHYQSLVRARAPPPLLPPFCDDAGDSCDLGGGRRRSWTPRR